MAERNWRERVWERARLEGIAAHGEGKSEDDCPYLYLLTQRSGWLAGHEQATKTAPVCVSPNPSDSALVGSTRQVSSARSRLSKNP